MRRRQPSRAASDGHLDRAPRGSGYGRGLTGAHNDVWVPHSIEALCEIMLIYEDFGLTDTRAYRVWMAQYLLLIEGERPRVSEAACHVPIRARRQRVRPPVLGLA
jgi:hypothetical protein